ncbi:MAG: T9SS type A sorting domain-containing protein [Breznakibacter sp.]
MKKIFLLALLASTTAGLSAQSSVYGVAYDYDGAGNRTGRRMATITLSAPKTAQLDSAGIKPLEENLGEAAVHIHPNPTKGMLRVEITGGPDDRLYTARLYSQSGNLLGSHKQTGNGQWPVDLTGRPSGYYILVLQASNHKKSYKIIKQQ